MITLVHHKFNCIQHNVKQHKKLYTCNLNTYHIELGRAGRLAFIFTYFYNKLQLLPMEL